MHKESRSSCGVDFHASRPCRAALYSMPHLGLKAPRNRRLSPSLFLASVAIQFRARQSRRKRYLVLQCFFPKGLTCQIKNSGVYRSRDNFKGLPVTKEAGPLASFLNCIYAPIRLFSHQVRIYWIGRYLLLLYAATPRIAPTLPWCLIFSRNDQADFI